MAASSPLRDPRGIALLLAATLTVMSNATISPALPGLEAMFSDTPDSALLTQLLVTAPSLTVALLAPFIGVAVDRIGARYLLICGVLIYGIAGTAGFWLNDLHEILASRFVLGLAVALTMTSQTALIGHFFAGEMRARFMGHQQAATHFSAFLFVGLAGYVSVYSPQLPFLIYGIAFLYLPLLLIYVNDPVRSEKGAPAPPASDRTPSWKRALGFIVLLAMTTFVLSYILPTQLPFHLAAIGLSDPTIAGQVIATLALFNGGTAFLFGRVRSLIGAAGTPSIGYVAMAAGFLILQAGASVPVFLLASALIGVGGGLVMPNFVMLALQAVPVNRRGVAGGVLTTAIFLGQFLSPIVSQSVLGFTGYQALFGFAALVLVCLSGITFIALRSTGYEN